MRFIAFVAFLISLAAAGWAGQALWQEWQVRAEAPAPRAALVAEAEPQPPAEAMPPRQWPLLFGELQPPKPATQAPPKPEDEPQPPAKKFPPLASMGYQLKGVVQMGEVSWALVSHPTSERVLRVGDALEKDLVVARIDASGLWAQPKGGEEMLLEWPE